ncbi:hypothetical protein HOK51_00015 [Candidatus Woesearchaeota archaeon]|jgi:hypothetical protein|nr:hypothetical protein [Candidatus Woesearchaeota archaeon]MBT6518196.1 hypothetical protein [Candidatus Woesearchaeota archaeon]MBT7368535.1 hypothetical protein [Candidatus Woesearchaeota archaeon]
MKEYNKTELEHLDADELFRALNNSTTYLDKGSDKANFRIKLCFLRELINIVKAEKEEHPYFDGTVQDRVVMISNFGKPSFHHRYIHRSQDREVFDMIMMDTVGLVPSDQKMKYVKKLDASLERVRRLDNLDLTNVLLSELKAGEKPDYEIETEIEQTSLEYETLKQYLETAPKFENGFGSEPVSNAVEQLELDYNKKISKIKLKQNVFISPDEVVQAINDCGEYKLADRVQLSATIGYDPKGLRRNRVKSLQILKVNNGRDRKQKWEDKSIRKIDEQVIGTLKSIANEDPHEEVFELANELIHLYEINNGSFKV